MDNLLPELSLPGGMAVGPSSPVQQTVTLVRNFLSLSPTPDIATPDSKSTGLLVGNHLVHLISACGLLNGSGLHSAAVTLLRPLEDALDKRARKRMLDRIAELADSPYDLKLSIKLTNQGGLRRSRVSGWRIIFLVDDQAKELSVVTIQRRGQVYQRV